MGIDVTTDWRSLPWGSPQIGPTLLLSQTYWELYPNEKMLCLQTLKRIQIEIQMYTYHVGAVACKILRILVLKYLM